MADEQRIALIIDGKDTTLNDRDFPVINAAQNITVAIAQGASVKVAIEAVESAQKAFPLWADVKPQEKRRLLQNLAKVWKIAHSPRTLRSNLRQVVQSWESEFKMAMVDETSCTEPYAEHNLRESVAFIDEAAALATSQALEGSIPSTTEDNCLALVLNEPLGVILSIVPWNAPLILGVRSFLGAVVAGNTVVVKVRVFHKYRPYLDTHSSTGIRTESTYSLFDGQSRSRCRIPPWCGKSHPAPTRRCAGNKYDLDCPSCRSKSNLYWFYPSRLNYCCNCRPTLEACPFGTGWEMPTHCPRRRRS